MFAGYIGTLFCLLLSMLVCAKTHNAVVAVTIPFAIPFIPMILNNLGFMKDAMGLFPDQLLQMDQTIRLFNLYQFGEKVIGSIPIMMVVYPILCVGILPVIYLVYHKTEVK